MKSGTGRWFTATVVAGTLDLFSAFVFSGIAGAAPDKVLAFVASGPFGDARLAGGFAAMALGAMVHYTLMAMMVAVYLAAADRFAIMVRRPWLAGVVYGFLLWIVMYWIIRPLRWPNMPLPHTALAIAEQLFSHVALVGIPIALIASRDRADHRRRVDPD